MKKFRKKDELKYRSKKERKILLLKHVTGVHVRAQRDKLFILLQCLLCYIARHPKLFQFPLCNATMSLLSLIGVAKERHY
jgi:hypothetical protein